MDNGDPRPGDMGCDQCGERGGVIVGVYASGPRIHVRDGTAAYSGKQFCEIPGRFFTADVLDVGAAHNLVCNRFTVEEADPVRLGSSNVQTNDTACNCPGREAVCVNGIRFWEAVCTVHLNRLLSRRQTADNQGNKCRNIFCLPCCWPSDSPKRLFPIRRSVGVLDGSYQVSYHVAGTFKPYREPKQVWRWPGFTAHRSVCQACRMLDERVNSTQRIPSEYSSLNVESIWHLFGIAQVR